MALMFPATVKSPAVFVTARLPPTVEAAKLVTLPLVRLAFALAPVVLSATGPASRLAPLSVMVPLFAVLVKLAAPATVSTPDCAILPAALTVRVPPTLDVAKVVARLLVKLALAPAPVVFNATVPVSELAPLSVIEPPGALSAKLDVPATVNAPDWTRLPAILTVRLPPMVETAKFVAPLKSDTVALPPAPVVFNDTAPLKRLDAPRVIVPLGAVSVKLDAPPTVSAPVCVRLPTESMTVSPPPRLDVTSVVACALVRLARPFAPTVLSVIGALRVLPALVNVIDWSVALLVKLDAPPTVSAPL